MEKLTKEQAELVLIAVNKIACAIVVFNQSTSPAQIEKYNDIKNEAVQSLRSIGVEIG